MKLLGILHVHWIFVLFISFVSAWHVVCKRTMCHFSPLNTHVDEKQAAYSELNYHHRNDRDYQIKFSSCG
jgi:uncharacterized ferritin-like protein (DUF455 family)